MLIWGKNKQINREKVKDKKKSLFKALLSLMTSAFYVWYVLCCLQSKRALMKLTQIYSSCKLGCKSHRAQAGRWFTVTAAPRTAVVLMSGLFTQHITSTSSSFFLPVLDHFMFFFFLRLSVLCYLWILVLWNHKCFCLSLCLWRAAAAPGKLWETSCQPCSSTLSPPTDKILRMQSFHPSLTSCYSWEVCCQNVEGSSRAWQVHAYHVCGVSVFMLRLSEAITLVFS